MWKVPLFRIYHDGTDVQAVKKVITRGELWAIGPEIEAFEKKIADYLGARYCVAFNSGTSALHATLIACKIGNGAKVAVPSFTFIATANAPLFVGARPVFVDIEEETLGLDPEKLADVVRQENVDAVIPVHYGGCPCKINEIAETLHGENVILIEDAAEAFGARVGKRKVGTFGKASVLSFAPNKVITTGEGGAVVTDSREVYERLVLVRSHGRMDSGNYFDSADPVDYVELGYNFRMASMVAALGISQLKKVDKIISMRRGKAHYMNRKLASVREVAVPKAAKDLFHIYQMYSIRSKDRDNLAQSLKKAGIMSKIYFKPVHLTTFYKSLFNYRGGELPVTEKVSKEILTLPLFPHIQNKEMDMVANQVKKFFDQ